MKFLKTVGAMARSAGRLRKGVNPKEQAGFVKEALKRLASNAKKRGGKGKVVKVVKKRRPAQGSIIKP